MTPAPVMRCWVCGKLLGGKHAKSRGDRDTCAVVLDPGGIEHRTHHACTRDAEGRVIRSEPVAETQKP